MTNESAPTPAVDPADGGTMPIRIVITAEAPLRTWSFENPVATLDAILAMLQLDATSVRDLQRDDMLRAIHVDARTIDPLAPAAPELRLLDAVLNGDPDLGDDHADELEQAWRSAFDASAELTEAVAAQRRGYDDMTPTWLATQLHRVQHVLNSLLVLQPPAAMQAAHAEPDLRTEVQQHLEHYGRCVGLYRVATSPGGKEHALTDALAALGGAVAALAVLHPPAP